MCFSVNDRKRFDFASYVRCLADNVWEDVDTDDDEDEVAEDGEGMDVDRVHLRKPGRYYRNQVMRDLQHICMYPSGRGPAYSGPIR